MEHLSNDHEYSPNQHENSHKLVDETGHRCESDGKSVETETITWSEFPNGGAAIVEQILASEEINPKEQDCENQSGIRVGKITIWVRSLEIEKL